DAARTLGTAAFSERMPEYCGATSRRPRISARLDDVEAAEAALTPGILEAALADAATTRVDRLAEAAVQHRGQSQDSTQLQPRIIDSAAALAECRAPCIIDIRAPAECEAAPLDVPGVEVIAIPFFELPERVAALPGQ